MPDALRPQFCLQTWTDACSLPAEATAATKLASVATKSAARASAEPAAAGQTTLPIAKLTAESAAPDSHTKSSVSGRTCTDRRHAFGRGDSARPRMGSEPTTVRGNLAATRL